MRIVHSIKLSLFLGLGFHFIGLGQEERLQRLQYNNPGLVVDLGVGLWAWPMPMDFDGDGDFDLVVVCPDKPFNGTYFFENKEGNKKLPVFETPVRISEGRQNVQVSYVDGNPRVLSPGMEHIEFFQRGLAVTKPLGINTDGVYQTEGNIRAKQWKYVDYDGDGVQDLIAGLGDWTDYGWDDAYNENGEWTNGPLRGFVFWMRNKGTDTDPVYDKARQLMVRNEALEVYGWPSPNFGDFDNDGDLDLLCGEFRDSFTYFENTGTRSEPAYAVGRTLMHGDEPLTMDLQMIVPVAFDWDRDGDMDLICGDEDGRVALLENGGISRSGVPVFAKPVYFQQKARDIKFGALATPYGVDWDQDGDDDIICGNTAGYIGFFENLGGGDKPKWAKVKLLKAGGHTIRIQAGRNGSIQGPAEAKWGYTTQTVADWDHDGLPDLIVNSIWGKVIWYRNIGVSGIPLLDSARAIHVEWKGKTPKPAWNWWNPVGNEFVSQWRTTPVAVDWNGDDLMDIVMLDHEGQLAFFERKKQKDRLVLLPGRRIFAEENGEALELIRGPAGKSGRRKLQVVDWDGDGRLDILFNSENADFYRNLGQQDGKTRLQNTGNVDTRKVSGHTSSPTVVDWDKNGIPDLLVGAEDGRLYYKRNARGR
jgi:hypothetical protein